MTTRPKTKERGRSEDGRAGRRARSGDEEAVRGVLMREAAERFAERGFGAVTLREIAAAARVNPAMIHYYFGGKQGLYEAVLAEHAGPVLEQLRQLREAAASRQATMPEILHTYADAFLRHPWLPRLVLRELLSSGEGPGARQIRRVATRAKATLVELITLQQARGQLRRDIEPDLGALAIVSLVMFPFVGRAVVEPVFGVRMDKAFFDRLIEHHTGLFTRV